MLSYVPTFEPAVLLQPFHELFFQTVSQNAASTSFHETHLLAVVSFIKHEELGLRYYLLHLPACGSHHLSNFELRFIAGNVWLSRN